MPRWAEPRVTRDVDLSLITGFGGEIGFIETILAGLKGIRDQKPSSAG